MPSEHFAGQHLSSDDGGDDHLMTLIVLLEHLLYACIQLSVKTLRLSKACGYSPGRGLQRIWDMFQLLWRLQ